MLQPASEGKRLTIADCLFKASLQNADSYIIKREQLLDIIEILDSIYLEKEIEPNYEDSDITGILPEVLIEKW